MSNGIRLPLNVEQKLYQLTEIVSPIKIKTMAMSWDAEKMRGLRLRMGWSQSDLARRLHIDSQMIGQWEMGLEEIQDEITQVLELLHRQADFNADEVSCESLAEILFEELEAPQIDSSSIHRKFRENQ